jgi:hypothetical protein
MRPACRWKLRCRAAVAGSFWAGSVPADWRTAFYYHYFRVPRTAPRAPALRRRSPSATNLCYAATTAALEKDLARLRKELKVPEVVPASWYGRGGEGGGGAAKKKKQAKQEKL